MAGQLTIDTLKASTGVLATQNGMTGIAKAWCYWQGGNGNTAGTINASFNVSSVTVVSSGRFTLSFTTAMPSANYTVAGCGNTLNGGSTGYPNVDCTSGYTQTVSAVTIWYLTNTSIVTPYYGSVAIFGA